MDAIVTAGGIPQPGEPLYEYTQGISKAMLDVAGKPMIQWVLKALDEAATIDKVIIIGLPECEPIDQLESVFHASLIMRIWWRTFATVCWK